MEALKKPGAQALRSELQTELVSRISEWIRNRDHERGARVSEAVLSRELGVSRTPIRAALQHLVGEGVLQAHDLGGYTVLQTPPLAVESMEPEKQRPGSMARYCATSSSMRCPIPLPRAP